ncbi:MAG: Iron-sulfur cluster assembly iron binding protein IscA, partial [uncultured Acetobacteraceae bacterium]
GHHDLRRAGPPPQAGLAAADAVDRRRRRAVARPLRRRRRRQAAPHRGEDQGLLRHGLRPVLDGRARADGRARRRQGRRGLGGPQGQPVPDRHGDGLRGEGHVRRLHLHQPEREGPLRLRRELPRL